LFKIFIFKREPTFGEPNSYSDASKKFMFEMIRKHYMADIEDEDFDQQDFND
jgi:hypothetical protein